jgi:hypothetical protein
MRRVGRRYAERSHDLPGRQVLVGEVCDKRQHLAAETLVALGAQRTVIE